MKIIILLLIGFGLLNASWQDDLNGFLNSTTDTQKDKKPTNTVTNLEMKDALKEALSQGVKYATTSLGKDGGYYNNPLVKIPIPESMQGTAKIVTQLGGEKYIKDFELSMNKAAQKAAPKTLSIFLDAITDMDILDAKNILLGDDDSATKYFENKTYTKLTALIKPIIQKSIKENDVYIYYETLNSYYKSHAKSLQNETVSSLSKTFGMDKYIPNDKDEDLDSYITSKAIDGLMKVIAQEEKEIRDKPIMRKTALLKKVFSLF